MASDALFYLQYLKGISEAEIFTVIHYEADKLLHFDYHSFTPEFICRLESKFPNMVTESSLANLTADSGEPASPMVPSGKSPKQIQETVSVWIRLSQLNPV